MNQLRRKGKDCLDDQQVLDYLDGNLTVEDQEAVERHLFKCVICQGLLAFHVRLVQPEMSPEEQAQLERVGLEQVAERAKAAYQAELARRQAMAEPTSQGIYVSWRLAASILAFSGAAVLVWFLLFHQSEAEKGMAALRRTYRQERPLQARLTGGFPYAPHIVPRGAEGGGAEQGNIDANSLRLARARLTRAANVEKTPEAYHGLGRFYLTQHEYDKALEQLQNALIEDPDNPLLHSDIGVAHLEKGRRSDSMDDFAQAIEYLTRALDLEPDLPEALFNRALCYQEMRDFSKAEADWKRYLEIDPTSPWATEAGDNLDQVKQRQKNRSQKREDAQQELLRARNLQDEEAAHSSIDRYPSGAEPLSKQTLLSFPISSSAI